VRQIILVLFAASVLAAASIEVIPTDSRLYDDLDLLKTCGFIRSMPSTSRPWTRSEALRLTIEAESAAMGRSLAAAQQVALRRLRAEFGDELPSSLAASGARRPVISLAVPEVPNGTARLDLYGRVRADTAYRRAGIGAVINNRPGSDFVFYERFEMNAYSPQIIEASIPRDSAGRHIPGMRVLPWRDVVTLETELTYLAFRLPWLRLELGRDKFVWGPGFSGSMVLGDSAPALDHIQLCARFRNFKFLSFAALLSRWGTKPRFLSAQRIELSLWNRVTLAGSMMDVASWDALQPAQLGGLVNPLIPNFLSEAGSGHDGNFLVGWDVCTYLPQTKLYAQLFVDNWEVNDWALAPNAIAAQTGAYWVSSLPLELRLEYNLITAFTYYHRVPSIMYENYLVPLGHQLGPDADQVLAEAGFTPCSWLRLGLRADCTRRGFFNRGGWQRQSFHLGDTAYLREYYRFPAIGYDSLGRVVEDVDRTVRLAPGLELMFGRDLRVWGTVGAWAAGNRFGVPGRSEQGFDFALRVEYRY
jgi:hypothetical protein